MNAKTYAGKTEAEIVSRNIKSPEFSMALDFLSRFNSEKHNEMGRKMFGEIAKKTRSPSLKAFAEAHA